MNDIKTANPCALNDNDFACASPCLNWVSNIVGMIFLVSFLAYLAMHCF